MPNNVKITSSHRVLMIALLAAAFACYLLVEPYINSIVMAFIISLLMFPVHEWFERKMPKHKNSASLLTCVVLTFIIVIPLLFVFAAIVQQGSVFSQNTYKWVTNGGIQDIFQHPWVIKGLSIVNEYLPFDKIEPKAIAEKIGQFATTFGSNLVAISAKILGDATNFLMDFFLMLFVLFFLLRDHDKIISAIRHILPLSRSQEDRILTEIEQVSKSAVMGSFLTAIAQGLAGGIGMWLAGFPGLFWGTMMGFASFIPVVGTALIWIPAAAYLFLTGDITWAIFLTAWSVVIVGSIDNLLRPLLMQGSAGMNTLMIFFSLLGGLHLFGLIGLIYGPLIFAVTMVLFNIYEEEFKDFLNQQDNS
ncbi:TPA: AI-2E family transporter [Vibrio parahaemolyticus]|uniref:AI-2E family transporter n=1 Tax=Vibrio parahaemolyticus TaxID=670 RepID=UPI0004038DEC|nr:AI-2E family transporter [Vibrio parahaemolyticus]TNY80097.1 AI-2E family transporter [Vibrio parahaemolyticus]TOL03330.1 AI-2E family transporter [Vibrio parahaemolyticus]HCE2274260.1 AI-2E family transporter [Vibrio parahaemolyticus]HCE2276110.1 AI-2E family transporter [Vibrio parahaemolyticus]HCE2279757.1 AI-2E family transporter [Vibrio parahaemolyticus]